MKYLDKEGLKELVRRIKQIKEIIISDSQPTGEDVSCWVDTSEDGNDIIIQESGSNENGNWIKFYDGTMICTKILDLGIIDYNTEYGYCFYNDYYTWQYPIAFLNNDVKVNATIDLGGGIGGVTLTKHSSSSVSFFPYFVKSGSLRTKIHCIAFGRWK